MTTESDFPRDRARILAYVLLIILICAVLHKATRVLQLHLYPQVWSGFAY